MISVRYWRKNSWPTNIDDDTPACVKVEELIVPESDEDLFIGDDGAMYYDMQCGHGVYIPIKAHEAK